MRMNRVLGVLGVSAALALTSACATNTSRFEWGNYETSLYVYAKKPDKRPMYKASLEKTIDTGRKSNRIAPGLLAELGYLYLEDGDTTKAISLFEEEMTLFPESRPFLTKLVARAKGGAATPAAAQIPGASK